MGNDNTEQLQHAVQSAIDSATPLCIRAGGSKDFYGGMPKGKLLDISTHTGIISYEPSELVVRVRAGTRLDDLQRLLDEHGQLLPFEPPQFASNATIGGTIACGLSGPRRPWAGAARDSVLGTHIINGRAECLKFGGQVMKNVAGYDVSRLMTGAMGTLGVLLDISMKILPKPESEITLALQCNVDAALKILIQTGQTPAPLSGAMYHEGLLLLRLSGAKTGVASTHQQLGGELFDNAVWRQLREHQLPFFDTQKGSLWRLSLPAATPPIASLGQQLIDWGGAQRWLLDPEDSGENREQIRCIATRHGGHAQLFHCRNDAQRAHFFHPLPPHQLQLQRAVKQAFDPHGILNPGRLYTELDR